MPPDRVPVSFVLALHAAMLALFAVLVGWWAVPCWLGLLLLSAWLSPPEGRP